jgi:hypothetical protein
MKYVFWICTFLRFVRDHLETRKLNLDGFEKLDKSCLAYFVQI